MSVEAAVARFEQGAYTAFLGVSVFEVGPERAVLHLPYQEENANLGGVLHGGATASVIQMAGALAAWTGIDFETEPLLHTVDLSVQYLAAAMQEAITAEAVVVRRGRDVFFLEITARGAQQQVLSKALMLYRAPHYTAPMRFYHRPAPSAVPPAPQTPPVLQATGKEFTRKLQITTVAHSPGMVRLAMPGKTTHHDEQGNLHAGALAALLDTAGTHAAWSLVQRAGARGATVGIQLSYPTVSPADVLAEAHVEQRSEEMFCSHVQIRAVPTGHLVATGHVSYRLLAGR